MARKRTSQIMTEDEKKRLQFNDEIGLTHDYYNVWASKSTKFQLFSIARKKALPVKSYLEFIRKEIPYYQVYLREKYPEDAEKIINASNRDNVQKLNALADAYNGRVRAGDYTEKTFSEFFLGVSIIYQLKKF
ncbi:hypothetical protein HYT52_04160 [Candidatus Woesearchaeota archaeon]|nr:hypothetical protein [Candidatus Woesearchaeota archaeon]